MKKKWKPCNLRVLEEIRALFHRIYPAGEYGSLADEISEYWINKLKYIWEHKDPDIKKLDLMYDPDDPLSRVEQQTVVIAYADSVKQKGEKSLVTLDRFLKMYFPSVKGIHILPPCRVNETRFNDGYFSQVVRNEIHDAFGSNADMADIMKRYFSMADFVLNHVDIDNPAFSAYLEGDDKAGECFFIFSEEEYRQRKKAGAFDKVFRPRPFPLFTIFRRKPKNSAAAQANLQDRITQISVKIPSRPDVRLTGIFYLFNKIKNDQMLLAEDYLCISRFIEFLTETGIDKENIFTVSETQEVQHIPYIFVDSINSRTDLCKVLGYSGDRAERLIREYEALDTEYFGEEFRALTTFSHVQADLNTATFEGLKMLADDFSWYLSMDLNMLRLDAANYAFKKWGTSCFGLPEVSGLMKVLYLSMESVSPRIIANLEVNDTFTSILGQMCDPKAPPPMMYDFYLPSMVPAVFITEKPEILRRVQELFSKYDYPETSIRFSVSESHDGKSVRGSMDMLTKEERGVLAETVLACKGKIKYKASPEGREPYELCTTTRNCLPDPGDEELEARRYLAFLTLAFAMMGRNVKSVYFNDLIGLSNDYSRFERSGELRDLKRTKSDYAEITVRLENVSGFESIAARGMNELIGLVNKDPAMHYRGSEAEVLPPGDTPAAMVLNRCGNSVSLAVINVSGKGCEVSVPLQGTGLENAARLYDNFSGAVFPAEPGEGRSLALKLEPFQRVWLTAKAL